MAAGSYGFGARSFCSPMERSVAAIVRATRKAGTSGSAYRCKEALALTAPLA